MIWIIPWAVAPAVWWITFVVTKSVFTANGAAVIANGLAQFVGGLLKW